MPRKALPSTSDRWPEIVRDCYGLFHDESWLPVASLVLGLPGEEEEDVVRTIDLVESLMGYTGLMLPLFFSPMSETRLGAASGFGRDKALPEHWELVGTCLEYNLRHLKQLHSLYRERMTAGPAIQMGLSAISHLSRPLLSKYMKRMKRGEPPN